MCLALLIAGLSRRRRPRRRSIPGATPTGTLVLSNVRTESGAPAATKTYAVPGPRPSGRLVTSPPTADGSTRPSSREHSRLNGVRSDLVRAVMQVESAFNPNAISPKGAMGLMQLMPATMRQYGVRNAFNPAENVRAGRGVPARSPGPLLEQRRARAGRLQRGTGCRGQARSGRPAVPRDAELRRENQQDDGHRPATSNRGRTRSTR